tara:strand:+ start:1199 stop:2755 length:1557 start_codon:yes stop_codon:yes gene_type:complete
MSETTEESPDKFFVIGDKSDTDKRFYINGSSGHVGINKIPTTEDTLCVDGNVKTDNLTVNTSATIGNGTFGFSGDDNIIGIKNKNLPDDATDYAIKQTNEGETSVNSTSNILFCNNNTTKMIIENTGNVGIGTDSPSELLTVQSASATDDAAIEVIAGYENRDAIIYLGTPYNNGPRKCAIIAQGTAGHTPALDNAGYSRSDLHFCLEDTANNGVSNANVTHSKMVIKNNGNVGIGTTSPLGKLHIVEENGSAPSVSTGTIILDHEDDGGISSIVFRSGGNRGSDHGYISYQDDYLNDTASERSLLTIGSGNDTTDHISLMPGTTAGGVSRGNVGIGTTTPQYKLDVVGDINFTGDITKNGSGGLIPSGGIIMWSGAVSNIPNGWVICNGVHPTPDLRGKFIIGAGGEESVGNTGGSNSISLSGDNLPSHNHTVEIYHSGEHSHAQHTRNDDFNGIGGDRGPSWGGYDAPDYKGYTHTWNNIDTAGRHNHTGSIGHTGGGDPFDNRPAYYALAYIMKI